MLKWTPMYDGYKNKKCKEVLIVTLSDLGIMEQAKDAVSETELKQVQQLATLAWGDAYLDKLKDDTVDLEQRVLGSLITSASDYGKTVNYVSDNGIADWKVFYETDDYVYLIVSEN